MKTLALSLALSLALLTGCHKNVVQAPIPGAVNQFDSDTYVSLATAKGAIDQAKVEYANNAFPASVAPKIKEAINYAVATYNIADTTYQAYHVAAVAGSATPAQQQAVSNAVSNMNGAVTGITSAKGGK